MKNLTRLIVCLLLSGTCFAAAPTISSFSPAAASSGMTVTINGTNFTASSTVSFGGTAAASVTFVSATQVRAVVASGTSGSIQLTTIDGTGSLTGFIYLPTSSIITDFGGYWYATGATPNPVTVDSSHHLLAFTYNGITWSTGVDNTILTSHGITYTAGNYRALPVAGISGVTAAVGSNSTYLALAKKVDGSATVANTPAISSFTVRNALTDGIRGLDLGTGVTNLPSTAEITFQIYNIDPNAVSDSEPDIILTQIAQPVTSNDVFTFLDAAGIVVGTPITQNMNILPRFGSYDLDLFHLAPNTSYNNATAYSDFNTNTNREIRVLGFRLSDFGILAVDASRIKALRITPSGNSDYAFIAYNANAINLPPNVSPDDVNTNTTICPSGTAHMAVVTTAVNGGAMSYAWLQSADGGTTWTAVSNGGNYSGATTNKLNITSAVNGYKYKVTVNEAGNPGSATSSVFTISVFSSAPPSSVSVTGNGSVCLNVPLQLSSTVTGGSNLFYQWQSNASGSYADISGAVSNNYFPAVSQTGSTSYRVQVSSGNGCGAVISAGAAVTVTGISSVVSNAVCGAAILTLQATATSGTIDWYAADAGGSPLLTGASFLTPLLSASKTYYVTASGCTSALRVPVTATIYPLTIPGIVNGSTSLVPGNNNATLTLNANNGTVIKWQSSTDLFIANVHDIANTSNQLSITNLAQTTSFRAVVQSGTCAAALSSPATLTVSSILGVHNKTVKATRQTNGVLVEWTAYDQQNTDVFEVQRSTDGIIFTTVHSTPAIDINNSVTYRWLDINPVKGNNFYRIKEVFRQANYDYSVIVKVMIDKELSPVSVYPNPVVGRTVQLHFSNSRTADYMIRVINSMGQSVYQSSLKHNAATSTEQLQLPEHISPGMYRIVIDGASNSRDILSLLVL